MAQTPTAELPALPELVTILIILLLVATGVALITRRLRIPYVTGLVIAGLLITDILPGQVGLDSLLVLNIFLPILLFEAAINTDVSQLRGNLWPLGLLAGPGVAIAAGVTALILGWGLSLDWTAALLVGVILAITDTVSVIGIFREIAVPSRLSTIVEGESLFNDGVALVLFGLILSLSEQGSLGGVAIAQTFVVVIIGGGLLGAGVGALATLLLVQGEDDSLGSLLLTVAVALGTNQLGQWLGVSGVVAVVVAGLMVGNGNFTREGSASDQVTLFAFWEYAGFGVNTFIFLLIGLDINVITLWEQLPAVLLAITAYQIGRSLEVYPLMALVKLVDRPVPRPWQHVLFLGNIKGSLSMALAISLPPSLPEREALISLVFGTVLLSVVGQGLSLPWLVKRLPLSPLSAEGDRLEDLQAQLITAKAAQEELEVLLKSGVLPKSIYEEMRAAYQVRVASTERTLRDLYNRRPDQTPTIRGDRLKLDAIRRRLLLVEKGALSDARRKRILSDTIVKDHIRTLNEQILGLKDD